MASRVHVGGRVMGAADTWAADAPDTSATSTSDRVHLAQFYGDDAFLVDAVTRFIGAGLGAGEAGVVIATRPHREAVEERLRARGVDVAIAREQGRYLTLDAAETLSQVLIDGWPDAELFETVVGDVIARAAGGHPRVHAFGEMVALLWADGKREATIRLEELWNALADRRSFSLLCGYPIAAFGGEGDGTLFLRVCGEHSEVVPAESYPALASPDERLRVVTHLQQKAQALETEMGQRKEAEAARQKTLRELMTLYAMGRILSAELDLQRLLQTLTDTATQLSGAQFGAFFYNATDDQGGHYLYTLSGASQEAFEQFCTPRNTPLLTPTFAGQGVVRLDDVTKDPRYGRNVPHRGTPMGRLPVTSYLAVPVRGRTSEVLGGLFLGHPEPGVFTDDAERVVVGLAAQAAIAIQNARLYEAERNARAEAEAGSRAKDEFLAMLGHELRNPLGAITIALAVLNRRMGDDELGHLTAIIGRQTSHLTRLVDDLLDVARVTSGKIEMRLALHDVYERARRCVDALVETGRTTAHSVTVEGESVRVLADPARIEQVIANLLDNALKYTPPGGEVRVVTTREGPHAVLRVCDNGEGIRPDLLGHTAARSTCAARAWAAGASS
ncbi:MAG: GAF domain-containing protein [Deltaproteobacteria bacterium]|nr:MAG: GAF domain-containing protein [Deltaproteobacteria bacterium]